MMDEVLRRDIFDIRYLKLHFLVAFTADTEVPQYKGSAFHGGLRDMLIWNYCIQERCIVDEDCDRCAFQEDCEFTHIVHPVMPIRYKSVKRDECNGYVIEIEDDRKSFCEGEQMKFSLILFGKTIVHANAIIRAVEAFGRRGLGSAKGRFRIVNVTNSKLEQVFNGKSIARGKYEILTVADYIRYRRSQIKDNPCRRIRFRTPTKIKFQHEVIESFRIDAILAAAGRRVSILDCFEGIENDFNVKEFIQSLVLPKVIEESHWNQTETGRSSNHGGGKKDMDKEGIKGELVLEEIPDHLLDYLLAGELIHIGSFTSYGFGKYHLT